MSNRRVQPPDGTLFPNATKQHGESQRALQHLNPQQLNAGYKSARSSYLPAAFNARIHSDLDQATEPTSADDSEARQSDRQPRPQNRPAITSRHPFVLSNFKYFLTLFSKFFSSFPHGTCSLSVSHMYLALDEIYHPLRAALPSNPTL